LCPDPWNWGFLFRKLATLRYIKGINIIGGIMPELEGIENLQSLEFYIDYFVKFLKVPVRFRCYDEEDIRQQAVMTLLQVYPKFKSELRDGRRVQSILHYLGKVIYNRQKNFQVANSFITSAKCWTTFERNAELFKEKLNKPVSLHDVQIAASGTEDINSFDLHLDIKEFCDNHTDGDILQMKLKGYTLAEIANKKGMAYPAVAWRHRHADKALKTFLAKNYAN
jgi:hypothetical protein